MATYARLTFALALFGVIAFSNRNSFTERLGFTYKRLVNKLHSHVTFRMRRATTQKVKSVQGSCLGRYYGRAGQFGSPNYPSDSYPAFSSCNYSVTASSKYVIKFEFLYVDMEDAPVQKLGDCGSDYIEIRDGPLEDSPLVGGQRFCGYDTPFNPVYSKTNKVYIYFRSDGSIQGQGFAIRWTATFPPKDEFDCDFESKNGLCFGWTQKQDDDFDWQLNHGQTQSGKSFPTGPLMDNTKKTKGGTYFYIEATGQKLNEKAVLMTPSFDLFSNDGYCFSFWYHMRGEFMGSLNVYMENVGDQNNDPMLFFNKTGEQGENWIQSQTNLSRSDWPVRFLFEGIRGDGFTSDLAIDDITMKDGYCKPAKPETTTTTPTKAPTTVRVYSRSSTTKATTATVPTTTATATTTRSTTRQTTPVTTLQQLLTNKLGQVCEDKYVCKKVGNCIDKEWMCDDIKDCQEGDDEENCDGINSNDTSSSSSQIAVWGPWADWPECSKTCGRGSQSRTRACIGGEFGEGNCLGASFEAQQCNLGICREWSEWGNWTACSLTCGGGIQTRSRSCIGGKVGELGCMGAYVELDQCNQQNCPKWSTWSSWSSCAATCGQGTMSKTRSCEGGEVGDGGCEGLTAETQTCQLDNIVSCPEYGNWEEWTECSATCGDGTQTRNRKCLLQGVEATGCADPSDETKGCNIQSCIRWEEWGLMSKCSKSCGSGTQFKVRKCIGGEAGEGECQGEARMEQNCNTKPCSAVTTTEPARWSEWNEWSSCSKTCGPGKKSSSRICMNGQIGKPGCKGPAKKMLNCKEKPCGDPVKPESVGPEGTCPKRSIKLAKKNGQKCKPICKKKCRGGKQCLCDGYCGKTCQVGPAAPPSETCPKRNINLAKKNGQKCKPICKGKCRGGKKCLCDGYCGKTCQNPEIRSTPAPKVTNPANTPSGGLACKKNMPLHNACCGKTSYNTKKAACCENTVKPKGPSANECCGKFPYSAKTKGCCGNKLFKTSAQKCVNDTIMPK